MQAYHRKIQKFISEIGLISLILGSIFALCYSPAMGMNNEHVPTSLSFHVATEPQLCCKSQNASHTLTAIGTVVNAVTLEGLFLLLGLGMLFLMVGIVLESRNYTRIKFLRANQFLFRLFDYLVQAFSRGVLHPKLYNA